MSIESSDHLDARCPRCGYDLRGLIETWGNACLLEGQCSECGLEFEWADLLSSKRQYPAWCVEYARSSIGLIRRSYMTLTRTYLPWSFWDSLKMWQEARWVNLCRYFIVLFLTIYAFLSVSCGLEYLIDNLLRSKPKFSEIDFIKTTLLSFSDYLYYLTRSYSGNWKIRVFWTQLGNWSIFIAMISLLCPVGFICLPVSRRVAKVRWTHIIRIALYGFGYLIGLILLAILMTELWAKRVPVIANLVEGFGGWILLILLFGYPVFLFIWWSEASGRYLRMPHAWGIGLAVVIMASLVAGLTITFRMLISFSNAFL